MTTLEGEYSLCHAVQSRLAVFFPDEPVVRRSVAPNSLSIWMRNIQGFEYQSTFTPQGCRNAVNWPSVTVGGGMEMESIYRMASEHGMAVVGAGSQDVAVGGYLTGGGHGALSAFYGLGADQVLEVELVTASGEILKANECQNSDLFWAVRGVCSSNLQLESLPDKLPLTTFN